MTWKVREFNHRKPVGTTGIVDLVDLLWTLVCGAACCRYSMLRKKSTTDQTRWRLDLRHPGSSYTKNIHSCLYADKNITGSYQTTKGHRLVLHMINNNEGTTPYYCIAKLHDVSSTTLICPVLKLKDVLRLPQSRLLSMKNKLKLYWPHCQTSSWKIIQTS